MATLSSKDTTVVGLVERQNRVLLGSGVHKCLLVCCWRIGCAGGRMDWDHSLWCIWIVLGHLRTRRETNRLAHAGV